MYIQNKKVEFFLSFFKFKKFLFKSNKYETGFQTYTSSKIVRCSKSSNPLIRASAPTITHSIKSTSASRALKRLIPCKSLSFSQTSKTNLRLRPSNFLKYFSFTWPAPISDKQNISTVNHSKQIYKFSKSSNMLYKKHSQQKCFLKSKKKRNYKPTNQGAF